MTNNERTPFVSQTLVYLISLPPSSLADPKSAIIASLHSNVLKYDPRVSGVLMSFKDISFAKDKCVGTILNEHSWLNFKVECTGTIFVPKVGIALTGTVNKCSSGHVGLLSYGFFNASVPESSLVKAGYTFEEGEEGDEGGEEGKWRKGENGDCIGVGSTVNLKVTKVHHLEGVVSLEGVLAS
mmetsp:Transcript_5436/g.10868  ORF Transcript_5436/g.10868 Transcript_5436/m.10868 type:complete len:183 (+) Transcript_5436:61-609(+)